MTSTSKAPVLVVLQLTGGNDYLNTVIPYTNPLQGLSAGGGHPRGQGAPPGRQGRFPPGDGADETHLRAWGYGHYSRRGLPERAALAFPFHGHLAYLRAQQAGHRGLVGPGRGRSIPTKKTCSPPSVSGRRCSALVLPGVPVACVDNLDTYGLLPGVSEQRQRSRILQWFAHMYSPAIGSGAVMDYLGQTGWTPCRVLTS